MSLVFQFGVHAEPYTYFSDEVCMAVDGLVSSLDFSLEFPEIEEMMFTLPPPLNKSSEDDLGISKNIHVNMIFFTCNIGSACFLKYADMPNVKHFRWIVDDQAEANWKEISSAFPSLETIEIIFSANRGVQIEPVLHGLEGVISAKTLDLTLDVFTLETAYLLGELQQFEEINITLTSYCEDVKTYQEVLQHLLPNTKVNVKIMILY